MELVRYDESECQAWFNANEMVSSNPREPSVLEPQVLSLSNICMINRSWTSTTRFSGCGWVWMDSLGNVQLMRTRNYIRRESALHSELEALRWAMENMLQHSTCQNFGTDCKDLIAMIKGPHAWPSFATELERIETLQICFPDFKITYIPRAHNQISDSLARTRSLFIENFILLVGLLIELPFDVKKTQYKSYLIMNNIDH